MAEVVPFRGNEDQGEQVEFDGMPVKLSAFKLTGVTKCETDRTLDYNQHVTFTGEGRVKGKAFDVDKGVLVHVIEVLDAQIT